MDAVEPKPTEYPGAAPWRVLLWWGAATALSFVALVTFSGGSIEGPRSTGLIFYVTQGLIAGAVLLIASFIDGRAAGEGNPRRGLSNVAVEHPLVVVAFVILATVYSALINLAYFRHSNFAEQFVSQDVWVHVFIFLIVCLFTPVAEELFFRGWAWNVLSTRGDAFRTALVASVLWLAMHWIQGIGLIIVLLPVAMLLACARHFSGSVRAPIAVHMAYNLVGLAVPWVVVYR